MKVSEKDLLYLYSSSPVIIIRMDQGEGGREVENYKEEEGMSLANLFICHAVFLLEGIVIESSLFLFPLNAVLVMMRFL